MQANASSEFNVAADNAEVTFDLEETAQPAEPVREEKLNNQIFELAIPSMTENLLQLTLLLADTYMIAKFGGKDAVAATAAAGHILWRTHMTFACVDRGTTALVARAIGAGKPKQAGLALGQSILLATTLGIVITVLGWVFSSQLLSLLGTKAEVLGIATPFMQVLFLGTVPRLYFGVAAAALRAAGDTRSPMVISLGMNVVNVVLNYMLIFGHFGAPRLGLVGSATSTIISYIAAAVVVTLLMRKAGARFAIELGHFRPQAAMCKSLVRVAMPAAIEEGIMTLGFSTFFTFIAEMGTVALAAHTISTRVEALSFMPGFGFSVAAATLVGQSLGMGNPGLAEKALRRSTWYCVAFMSFLAVCLILGGDRVVNVFSSGDETVACLAQQILLIAALQQPLLAIVMVLGGGLRGAGDTTRPMMASLAGNVGVRVGLGYVLAFECGWGLWGVYTAMALDWTIRTAMLFVFFRDGHWLRIKL